MTSENFKSKDLTTVTILFATDHKLTNTYWASGACYFVFEDSTACGETMTKFYQSRLKIDAKKLLDSQKNIRNILYATGKSV
jgi:hypothetical protein